ncbi:MAG: CDP-archaeol synthase [Nanoarchaeota archaeon]
MIFGFFMVQLLWLMIPGVFANIFASVSAKFFPWLGYPMDMGKSWRGKRILGDHKTLRGYIFGISSAVFAANMQTWVHPYMPNVPLLDYSQAWLVGLLIGAGVLVGDSVKSFFKRRAGIPPGGKFIPWDQIDSALGGLVFVSFAYALSWQIIVTSVVLAFVLHVTVRHVAYWLKIEKTPWA